MKTCTDGKTSTTGNAEVRGAFRKILIGKEDGETQPAERTEKERRAFAKQTVQLLKRGDNWKTVYDVLKKDAQYLKPKAYKEDWTVKTVSDALKKAHVDETMKQALRFVWTKNAHDLESLKQMVWAIGIIGSTRDIRPRMAKNGGNYPVVGADALALETHEVGALRRLRELWRSALLKNGGAGLLKEIAARGTSEGCEDGAAYERACEFLKKPENAAQALALVLDLKAKKSLGVRALAEAKTPRMNAASLAVFLNPRNAEGDVRESLAKAYNDAVDSAITAHTAAAQLRELGFRRAGSRQEEA